MKKRLVKSTQYAQLEKKHCQNAITLIALVVTIVVLLILAGVSIVVLFGDNGIIKVAGDSTLQTKLSEIEERANIVYADLNTKKYTDGNSNKVVTMQDVKTELERIDSKKYQIRIENPEGSLIKEIKLDKENIKLGKGDKATLKATFEIEENSNTHYYIKVEEKYYEMSIANNHINLDKANGKLEEEIGSTATEEKPRINVESANINVVTIGTITEKQTEVIIEVVAGEIVGEETVVTVTYGNLRPVTCKIIVKLFAPINNTPNNTPIVNGHGKIDIIWIDENNNILEEPKAPILQSKINLTAEEKMKMKPIKWNGTTLVTQGVDEENKILEGEIEKPWYDYQQNR